MSDRKYGGSRVRKRKHNGNRFTTRSERNESESSSNHMGTVSDKDSEHDVARDAFGTPKQNATPTRSEMKLQDLYKIMQEDSLSEFKIDDSDASDCDSITSNDDVSIDIDQELEGNRVIDIRILSQNITSNLVCRYCHNTIQFLELKRQGLASDFVFHCLNTQCHEQTSFPSCHHISVSRNLKVNSVNRRSALAMRCVGGDRADLKTFCAIMDLPPPVGDSSYSMINSTMEMASGAVQAASMKKAANTEFDLTLKLDDENDKCRHIDVSVDGSWMTRGHSSKIGVTTAIGCTTGKVLDTGTLSKICKSCDYWDKQDKTSDIYRKWRQKHADECTNTHAGSSGNMEPTIAKQIFHRSVESYSLRYTRFIGDGDTNSFKQVFDSAPYGQKYPVEKIECVGHVQKRMGTRLRKLRDTMKAPLADGKKLTGKGRLTLEQVNIIQKFYGDVIRGNKNNLTKMREAVWGIYFHVGSTDENPVHNFCSDNLCKYRKAVIAGTVDTYTHPHPVPVACMEVVKPVFKDLANTDLLRKCLDGYTQNANESLNNLIWKYCPKHKAHGLTVAQVAVSIAVSVFNDGASALGAVMQEMGLLCGTFARDFFEEKDTYRIKNAQRRATAASLEARRARRRKRLRLDETNEEREGHPYQCGGH